MPAHEAGEAEAKAVARRVGSGFPVFYPTRLPSGAYYVESNPYEHVQDPRVYHFKDADGNRLKNALIIRARDMTDAERIEEDTLRAEEKEAAKARRAEATAAGREPEPEQPEDDTVEQSEQPAA